METFEHNVTSLTLVPAKGGVFEVTIDGDLVYSKKATGRHAEYTEIDTAVRTRL